MKRKQKIQKGVGFVFRVACFELLVSRFAFFLVWWFFLFAICSPKGAAINSPGCSPGKMAQCRILGSAKGARSIVNQISPTLGLVGVNHTTNPVLHTGLLMNAPLVLGNNKNPKPATATRNETRNVKPVTRNAKRVTFYYFC